MKKRKKPDKFLLPHGMPSDEREFAFSSRVLPKALKIKAPYKSWHYQLIFMVCSNVFKRTITDSMMKYMIFRELRQYGKVLMLKNAYITVFEITTTYNLFLYVLRMGMLWILKTKKIEKNSTRWVI